MKVLWTGQAVHSHLTSKCVLDLGPSHTVIALCILSHDGERLY